MGLDKAQAYLAKRRAHEIKDWGSSSLDEEGTALQNELEQRQKVSTRNWPAGLVCSQALAVASAINKVFPSVFSRAAESIIACLQSITSSLA